MNLSLRRRRRDRAARAAQRLMTALPAPRAQGWVPSRPPDQERPSVSAPSVLVPSVSLPVVSVQSAAAAAAPSGATRDRPRHRLAVDGWAAVVVLIVLGGGLLVGLAVLWRARPHALAAPGRAGGAVTTPADSGPWSQVAATAAPGSAHPSPAAVVVHVAGLVRRPGVVTLTPGSRVADAVAAVGGVASGADPATVNLARPVVDGEQVVVRASGAPPPAPGPPGGADPTAPLDLNTADQAALEGLPGVGPVLAGRILDWRAKHGRFSSVDELREVSGIGEKMFAALAERVRV